MTTTELPEQDQSSAPTLCDDLVLDRQSIRMHNHPSGDLTPSSQDIQVTNKLREVGNILGIGVTDPIIVGHDPITDQWSSMSFRQTHPWS